MISLSTPPLSLPTQLSVSLIPKPKHLHTKATMADQAVAVTYLEIFPLGCHMDFSLSLVWFWFDFGLRWIFRWWLGGTLLLLLLLLLLVSCFEMVVVVLVVWWFPSSSFGGLLWNGLWWSWGWGCGGGGDGGWVVLGWCFSFSSGLLWRLGRESLYQEQWLEKIK